MSECSNKPRNYSIVFKLTNFSLLNLFPFYLPCCRFENYLTKLFAGFSGICGIFYLPRVLVNPLICLLSLLRGSGVPRISTSADLCFLLSFYLTLFFILLDFFLFSPCSVFDETEIFSIFSAKGGTLVCRVVARLWFL